MTAIVKHTIRSNQAAAGTDTAAPAQPRNSQLRRQFPPRPGQERWPATAQGEDEVLRRLALPPFLAEMKATQAGRRRGTAKLLHWLSSFPGDSWQQRWEASQAEDRPGSSWVQLPFRWLQDNGLRASSDDNDLSSGLLMLICADVIRPGLAWMLTRTHRYLAIVMAETRDPAGFARLRELAEAGPASSTGDARYAATRVATLMACKGGLVGDITVGDCVELVDTQRRVHARGGQRKVDFYLRLRALGIFPADAPATIRAFGQAQGQLTVEELVDRYRLQCKPVRDLLVDYLKERQPALDYASLDSVSTVPGRPVLGQDRGPVPGHRHARAAAGGRPRLEGRPADHQARRHRPGRAAGRRHPPADQRQGRADPRPGPLSRHRPVGHGGTRALGAVGSPEPGQRRRDQLGQGTPAAQGPDGPADPRAAARAARPRPHRRRPQDRDLPPPPGRHDDTARRDHRGHRRDTAQGRRAQGQRAARVGRGHRRRQAPQPVL